MKLFTLLYGKSKKKLRPIMTDSLHKCQNYRDSREPSVRGFHDIVPAEEGATVWRQKTSTIGGNKYELPRVGKGPNGYINKYGFNPHT